MKQAAASIDDRVEAGEPRVPVRGRVCGVMFVVMGPCWLSRWCPHGSRSLLIEHAGLILLFTRTMPRAGSAHQARRSFTKAFHLYSFHQAYLDLSVQPCCSGNARLKSFKAWTRLKQKYKWMMRFDCVLTSSTDGGIATCNALLQLLKKITRRWAATVNRKCASITQSWMCTWCPCVLLSSAWISAPL